MEVLGESGFRSSSSGDSQGLQLLVVEPTARELVGVQAMFLHVGL